MWFWHPAQALFAKSSLWSQHFPIVQIDGDPHNDQVKSLSVLFQQVLLFSITAFSKWTASFF